MKYGLMYFKDTDNIGDDIQAYVAKRFLPHIDYYIDREALSCFIPDKKEYVSMIMNGWYIYNKLAWPPSPYINPLLISMHFMTLEFVDIGDTYLKGIGGDYLKEHEPIGSRDIATMEMLRKNGIDSYFSGCMTLTAPRFENIEKNGKIYVVDLKDNELEEKIKNSTTREIEFLTHDIDPKETAQKSFEQRMNEVEELLKKYQGAHLVITSRLHVALPCIALGTPVILIHKQYYEEGRLGTFFKFMDNYLDKDFLNMDITSILENPKSNNTEYLTIRENLIKQCKDFIEKCENSNFDIEKLPEIDEYYNNHVKSLEWYKDLFLLERKKAEENALKLEKEYNKFIEKKKKLNLEKEKITLEKEKIQKDLEEKIKNKEIYIEKLETEITNEKIKSEKMSTELVDIYNSKGWKFLEKVRKILRKDK